jgi:dienelactone hydrolase
MREWVELKAADGHELSAYVAKPEGEPLGALVVIQEIFGVNGSIRSVADDYAPLRRPCSIASKRGSIWATRATT